MEKPLIKSTLLALLLSISMIGTAGAASKSIDLTGSWVSTDGQPGTIKFGPGNAILLSPDSAAAPLSGTYVLSDGFLEIKPNSAGMQPATSLIKFDGNSKFTLRYDKTGDGQSFIRKK